MQPKLAALAFVAVVLSGRVALADVQACLGASEKGQQARKAGKLREARDQFVICGADSCPAMVRHDCSQWNSEIGAAMPTVVFGARDKSGRDLFDVTVSMDGTELTKKLDGKSVAVDPGKHTFRFEVSGYPPVTEVALVKEGERARVLNVTFDVGAPLASPTTTAPASPERPLPKNDPYTAFPWIVVGLGAVGLGVGAVIVVTSPDLPGNCREETQTCTRIAGQSEADFKKDQEQAGTADSQPLLGYIVGGAGAALIAGGLVWHFLEPSIHSSGSGLRVAPWATAKASGLSLAAEF